MSNFTALPLELLKIERVTEREKIPFELLQLADPSMEKILVYLKTADCYVGILNDEIIGAFVIEKIDNECLEIKNIAISGAFQNLGYGKWLLNVISSYARREEFKILRICTGNSSIGQLALYQKMGFDIIDVQKDYFLKNYSEKIWENGIRCKHLVVLEKEFLKSHNKKAEIIETTPGDFI